MSRKGNCLDNACMESFFSHFKAECFYRYQFESSNEVKEAVKNYIKIDVYILMRNMEVKT